MKDIIYKIWVQAGRKMLVTIITLMVNALVAYLIGKGIVVTSETTGNLIMAMAGLGDAVAVSFILGQSWADGKSGGATSALGAQNINKIAVPTITEKGQKDEGV
jgi:hypothetical protein